MNRKELVERQEALQRELVSVRNQLNEIDTVQFLEDYRNQYEGRYFKHYNSYKIDDESEWPVYFHVKLLINQHSFSGNSIEYKPLPDGYSLRITLDSQFDLSMLREEVPEREYYRTVDRYAAGLRELLG